MTATATLPPVEQIMSGLHASTVQTNTGDRRRVESRYTLVDLPDTERETSRRVVVKVTTFHYGDRKKYQTSIMQVETAKSVGSPFSVEKFSLFSGVGLTSTPVARHSAKAMAAAHESGLAVLEEALRQMHPKVVEQFQVKSED